MRAVVELGLALGLVALGLVPVHPDIASDGSYGHQDQQNINITHGHPPG